MLRSLPIARRDASQYGASGVFVDLCSEVPAPSPRKAGKERARPGGHGEGVRDRGEEPKPLCFAGADESATLHIGKQRDGPLRLLKVRKCHVHQARMKAIRNWLRLG